MSIVTPSTIIMGLCYSARSTFKVEILLPSFPLNSSLCFHFCNIQPFSIIPYTLTLEYGSIFQSGCLVTLPYLIHSTHHQNDLSHGFHHVANLLKNIPLFLSVTKYLILTLKTCHHLLFPPLPPRP